MSLGSLYETYLFGPRFVISAEGGEMLAVLPKNTIFNFPKFLFSNLNDFLWILWPKNIINANKF